MTHESPRLFEILKGNQDAYDFCWNIAFISEVFDDLVDGDFPDSLVIEDALKTVLNLPANRFYREFFDALHPLVNIAMIHWQSANRLQSAKTDLEKAHFFRYLGMQIWVGAAALVGGMDWATDHTHELWCLSTMETLEEFKLENV